MKHTTKELAIQTIESGESIISSKEIAFPKIETWTRDYRLTNNDTVEWHAISVVTVEISGKPFEIEVKTEIVTPGSELNYKEMWPKLYQQHIEKCVKAGNLEFDQLLLNRVK